ncbi:galactose oxidase early set domain-containing protein [Dolichospermum sp. UHCC 0259]|uniref:galactose oxidase early set domain-containing protein n=1 Tax=Dolichospermum sp. UHCC 0259 TaxID=2590010 RepID=UPI0014462306|nr:galactose oxidase early set domain-containing protein [Dolichospermum sp. UHCC 0259]MTJ47830.1 DUF1929 domain-containing protein [Dolichospermum sp. UHCC 0259]
MKIVKPLPKGIKIVSVFLVFFLSLCLTFLGWDVAICLQQRFAIAGPKETMGKWTTIPMPPQEDRMQSVHTIVLPNGKVLMVNGSSFRSTLIEEDGKYKFKEGVDPKNYNAINNTGLLNPETGKFERISSPPASQNGTTNDLFCLGHVQLADGNVLFIGGTGRYYPGGAFTGTKQINLYKWQTGEWKAIGETKDGRWYPSLIPLASGKVVIFSGLKWDKPNQINPSIEIYDPKTEKLQYFDPRLIENSPFNTKVEGEDVYDSIDLYPRVFPLKDGRLLITGDEAGIAGVSVPHFSKKSYLMSVQEADNGNISISFEVGPDRLETNKAYGTALQVPNSEDVILLGGIIGTNNIGFGRGGNTSGFPKEVRIASSLQHWIAPEKIGNKIGKWELFDHFLDKPRANLQAVILPTKEILVINGGRYPEYQPVYEPLLMTPDAKAIAGYRTKSLNPGKFPRLYHNGAVLLPDARVLVVGGNANRAALKKDGTVRVDVLGDPQTFFTFAKLHNQSGEPEEFDLDTFYKDPQHYYAEGDSEPFVPAEIWQGEIFSPPYLFKSGKRPQIKQAPDTLEYGKPGTIRVANGTKNPSLVLAKLGAVTHSFDYGQRLAELPIKVSDDSSLVEFTAPNNANLYPPGYYMMFYLNDLGKPAKAKIIKLQAA